MTRMPQVSLVHEPARADPLRVRLKQRKAALFGPEHMAVVRTPRESGPMVGVLFWSIKIVATTLGESVSHFVSMAPLNLGYATSAQGSSATGFEPESSRRRPSTGRAVGCGRWRWWAP